MSKSKDVNIVILAGGSGTRFWPMSRQAKPKQFLDVTGQGTLLQQTLQRVYSRVSGSNIYIVTGQAYKKEIAKQVAKFKVPAKNILLEPAAKNTAPAVAWAAAVIHKKNPNAVMVVLPSDHLISKTSAFLGVLDKAVRLANQQYLVTLGIVPNRPETGYGYLKTKTKTIKGKSVVIVDQFTEKPNLVTAKKFVKNKNYFWNSGMFIWRTDVILEEFQTYLPSIYNVLSKNVSQAQINKVWQKLPGISIDYGILEKSKRVGAVPAHNIGWSDLGSWESLTEILKKDKNQNIIRGDVLQHDCKNSLIFGGKKLVATVGVEDLLVVDTDDALFVGKVEKSQDVREIVAMLKDKKRKEA